MADRTGFNEPGYSALRDPGGGAIIENVWNIPDATILMGGPMHIGPAIVPPLDPDFVPAELWNRAYRARCKRDLGAHPLAIAPERDGRHGDALRYSKFCRTMEKISRSIAGMWNDS